MKRWCTGNPTERSRTGSLAERTVLEGRAEKARRAAIKQKTPIKLGDHTIEEVTKEKYLGVILTSGVVWESI